MNDQPAPPKTRLRASFDDTRRVAGYLVVLIAVVLAGLYFIFHVGQKDRPHSSSVKTPALAAPAGGDNQSSRLDDITSQQERKNAEDAARRNQSYTAALTGRDIPKEQHIAELGDLPGTGKPQPPAPASAPPTPAPPPPAAPVVPAAKPASTPPGTAAADDPFSSAPASSPAVAHGAHRMEAHEAEPAISLAAQAELIAAWSGHGSTLEMMLPDNDSPRTARRGNTIASASSTAGTRSDAARDVDSMGGGATRTSSSGGTDPSAHAGGKLLLAAGRGVYGHSVITSNSDLGSEVLVEIDSGPFAKARISGALEMKNDRLIIKFNRLMIGDAAPLQVSAYAVSPKTAETGVASEVNEHLATRIILPTAAAFVEGLGNAMMSANTTSYTGGYGVSAFTHLNLAQQMGAAGGRMGQELSQVLQKQTPQQATVKLKQGDEIGVLFDEPVYAP